MASSYSPPAARSSTLGGLSPLTAVLMRDEMSAQRPVEAAVKPHERVQVARGRLLMDFLGSRKVALGVDSVRMKQSLVSSDEQDFLVDYVHSTGQAAEGKGKDLARWELGVERARSRAASATQEERRAAAGAELVAAEEALAGARRAAQHLHLLAGTMRTLRNTMSHTSEPDTPLPPRRARFCLAAIARFFHCLLRMAPDFPDLAGWPSDGGELALVQRTLELEAWARRACELWSAQAAEDAQRGDAGTDDLLVNYTGDPASDDENLWRRAWHFLAEPPDIVPAPWPAERAPQAWLELLMGALKPERKSGKAGKAGGGGVGLAAVGSREATGRGFYDPALGYLLAAELAEWGAGRPPPWLAATHEALPARHAAELRAWLAEFLSQGSRSVAQPMQVRAGLAAQADIALDLALGHGAETGVLLPLVSRLDDADFAQLCQALPRQRARLLRLRQAGGQLPPGTTLGLPARDAALALATQLAAAYGPAVLEATFELTMATAPGALPAELRAEAWAPELARQLVARVAGKDASAPPGDGQPPWRWAVAAAAAGAGAAVAFRVLGFSRGSLVARVAAPLPAALALQIALDAADGPPAPLELSGVGRLEVAAPLALLALALPGGAVGPWALPSPCPAPALAASLRTAWLGGSELAAHGLLPAAPPGFLDMLAAAAAAAEGDGPGSGRGKAAAAAPLAVEEAKAQFSGRWVAWGSRGGGGRLFGVVTAVVEATGGGAVLEVAEVAELGRAALQGSLRRAPSEVELLPIAAAQRLGGERAAELVGWLRAQWKAAELEPAEVAARCALKLPEVLRCAAEANLSGAQGSTLPPPDAPPEQLLGAMLEAGLLPPPLARELHPFVTDYRRQMLGAAAAAGYVPARQAVDAWLRAICRVLQPAAGLCSLTDEQQLDLAPLHPPVAPLYPSKPVRAVAVSTTGHEAERDSVTTKGVNAPAAEGEKKGGGGGAGGGASAASAAGPAHVAEGKSTSGSAKAEAAAAVAREVFWNPSCSHPDIPDEFRCPISSDVMVEPVAIETGHVYEKANIAQWLSQNSTCPMTGLPLSSATLTQAYALRSAIHAFMSKLFQDERAHARRRVAALLGGADMSFSLPERNEDTGTLRFSHAAQALALAGVSLSRADCEALASVLAGYTNPDGAVVPNAAFSRLELAANGAGSEGIKLVSQALSLRKGPEDLWAPSSHLSELVIDRNRIGRAGAAAIAELLRPKQNPDGSWVAAGLQRLELHKNQIGAAGASALAEALSPQQHKDGSFVFPSRLQSLRLISERLGDSGAAALAMALKPRRDPAGGWVRNTALTELVLTANEIGDEGAEAIARAMAPQLCADGTHVSGLPLAALDLRDNEIECDGARAIGEALQSRENADGTWSTNSTLQTLSLYGNNMSGDSLRPLADALTAKRLPGGALVDGLGLQHLTLSLCGSLGDSGAAVLASALQPTQDADQCWVSASRLRSLDIGYCKIGEAGVRALAAALEPREGAHGVNTALLSLNLMCNSFEPEGAARQVLEAAAQEVTRRRAPSGLPQLGVRF
eukprot:jgi/Tetstr1/437588/TSEL_026259.t1